MELMKRVRGFLKENLLLVGTLIGVIVGLILGFSLKQFNPDEETQQLLAYPGEIFLRALQMMILPVVMCSLFVGAGSLDAKSNGKIVLLTFGYFLATTMLNAILGVGLAIALQPGDPSILTSNSTSAIMMSEPKNNSIMSNFLDLGRNIVPNNMFTAFFEQTISTAVMRDGKVVQVISSRSGTNTLGVITYTLVLGAILGTLGEGGKHIFESVKTLEILFMKTTTGIIWATPVGVASIICAKIIEVEDMWSIMTKLALFVTTVIIGIFIYQLIIMQVIYFMVTGKNPFKFYVGVLPAAITGFSTDSSAAALPVTLRCMDENVRVDKRVSRFVVPIGVIVNMDGTALFVCVASIFIAQMNSISLSLGDYVVICVTSALVSVATASAPSASLTMLFMILNAINAPTKDIGLLFAIDWFVDRLRTTNNILGDCYAAAVVEHFTKTDLEKMPNDNQPVSLPQVDKQQQQLKIQKDTEI